MNRKIIVAYWHSRFKDLPYEHQQEFEYSVEKQHEIVDFLLSKGYSVMLRPSEEQLIIWIDNGRFGQR